MPRVLQFGCVALFVWGTMVALTASWPAAALAQSQAQIQQVMQMSPAERQRLMRQYGISEQDVMRMLGEQRSATRPSPERRPERRPDRERDPSDPDEMFDPEFDPFIDFQPVPEPEEWVPDERDMSARIDYSKRYGLRTFTRGQMPMQELYSIPVPDDYVIGPGDEFRVSLFGTETGQFFLPVERDGWVDFPQLGPIDVAGLTFADARRTISERIGREMIGVRSSVTLNHLKTIQIAVSGEVRYPGVYVVPSLVSVIQLLNLAGGTTDVGALRRVRLLRSDGRVDIDLYEFLITGERSDVIGLRPGDRLHVPAVEAAVQVMGAVRRPGIYEILPGEQLEAVLAMAGGSTPDAALDESVLRRFTDAGRQEIVDVDLRSREQRVQRMQDGMILRIPRASEFTERQVRLKGEVTVPGVRQWRPDMRLSRLFRDMRSDIRVGRADLDQGYIVRTDPETRAVRFVSFSPREMFRAPGSEADPILEQEDVVLVLPMPQLVSRERERAEDADVREDELDAGRRDLAALDRSELLEPYLWRLGRQTRDGGLVPVFTVRGQVHAAGTYPITQKRHFRDALQAAGGLTQSADLGNALVLRRQADTSALEVFTIDLERVRGDDADMALMPGDILTIRRDPSLGNRVEVRISGEVASPGDYTLPAGSTLGDLMELAGGVTQRADLRAAVLSRARLREMERQLRQRHVADIRQTLVDANVAGDRRAMADPTVLGILDLLEEPPADGSDGRLQIDLPRLAAGDMSADLVLSDGDRLRIPSITNAISVAGQVRSPGSFAYVPGMSVASYLELAGGFGPYADDKEVFILRADGSVQLLARRSSWNRFGRQDDELLPGDRIVVPIEYDYINRWDLAKEVVQFVYQTGIGLAAVVAALRR